MHHYVVAEDLGEDPPVLQPPIQRLVTRPYPPLHRLILRWICIAARAFDFVRVAAVPLLVGLDPLSRLKEVPRRGGGGDDNSDGRGGEGGVGDCGGGNDGGDDSNGDGDRGDGGAEMLVATTTKKTTATATATMVVAAKAVTSEEGEGERLRKGAR